jgi:hypothetical protein
MRTNSITIGLTQCFNESLIIAYLLLFVFFLQPLLKFSSVFSGGVIFFMEQIIAGRNWPGKVIVRL